ncbi:MAG: Tol-Pal system beta propeller repeat protein TolB [Desulfococcus multivorans]|jgi:TolB protein|uniref:Tol-Pal system beta propeller repeat protein TolB n=1 Tax=Desulfococcus sp. TaxID=2025834 RepID=UPI002A433F85|nr:Tol-Pal system beta propeller repeat protein TolB [Desulfococcus multivorans]
MIKDVCKTVLMGVVFWLASLSVASAQYDYIDIRNPSLKKIPIAIPAFRVSPTDSAVALKSSNQIAEYLDFTGFFKILDRGMFLMDPQNPETDRATVKFQNWKTIGAELLVTGNILTQGDLVDMELRLFDPFKGEMLIGKRYKGWKKDMPQMLRRFCSEIIYLLTGSWGVFDSRIAFVSTATGHKEVFTCDFDGSNPKQMTRFKSITLTPAWGMDGSWIAYTSYAKGRPDLYILNPTGKQGTIVSKKGLNTTPAWVPGQFKLAATFSFSGDQDIYLLTGDGKIIKQLTENWGIDTSPTFSPDGRRMAFVSNRSGTPQIYIKDIGSGKVERLTYEGRYNTQPNWSPRGDKICYTTIEGGEINIHAMDLKTRQAARLTYHAGKNEAPSWSPDGTLIVFSSNREKGISRIYVMTAYGTDQRRLIQMGGEQFTPSWSPKAAGN